MRFIIANSNHTVSHWLIVVLVKTLSFFITTVLSAYLAGIGLLLSAETIKPFTPLLLLQRATFYSGQLPFFQSIKFYIFNQLNHWFLDALVWWTMVVGIPLILAAVAIFFSNLFNFYYAIVDSQYNHTHCPFCKPHIKIQQNKLA